MRTPIDAFILARLDKEGLKPSPEADRITLLRRLHLDLTGLPPTIAEVDAFLADKSANAYEKAVERLLKSPHYGERWARHWLDAARYADSDGYEKDKSRQVWFYRDWVVNAFNRDLPYDQFVREQIAGDLLPNATQDQIVATGFLRHSMLNEEGGVDPEQFRMDAMFDRIDALGKAVLGLTIACAQCHNHKYDPLTQEEYYKLFAYLNNDHEAQRVVYTAAEQQKIAEIRRTIGEIDDQLRHTTPDWQKRMEKWEASLPAQPAWEVVQLANQGDNSQRYIEQKDGSILCQGYAPTKFATHMRGTTGLKSVTGFRLELLNDPNLPCNGPGRSFMGTCALSEFNVDAWDAKDPKTKVTVKFVQATRRLRQSGTRLGVELRRQVEEKRVTGPVSFAIDGKDDTAWGIDAGPGRRNTARNAVFVPRKADQLPERRRPRRPPEADARRLEQRRPHEQQPRPLPAERDRCGEPRSRSDAEKCPRCARHSRGETDAEPGGRALQLLADDGTGVEGRERPDRRAVETVARGSTRNSRCKFAMRCATRASSSAATS